MPAPTPSPDSNTPSGAVIIAVVLCAVLVLGVWLLRGRRNTAEVAEDMTARPKDAARQGEGWIAKSNRRRDVERDGDNDDVRVSRSTSPGERRRLGSDGSAGTGSVPAAGSGSSSEVAPSTPRRDSPNVGSATGAAGKSAGPARSSAEAPIKVEGSIAPAAIPGVPATAGGRHLNATDAVDTGAAPEVAANPTLAPGEPTPVARAAGLAFVGGQDFDLDNEKTFPNGISISGDSGTVSFCLQPQWGGGEPTDASFLSTGGTDNSFFSLGASGQSLQFTLTNTDGVDSSASAKIDNWQAGERHLVTAAWGNEKTFLYVDGHLVDQQTYQGKLQIRPDTPLHVGSSTNTAAPGALTNLQIYNRSLVDTEIGALTPGCQ